jgi:glycosyltransferase involved in cell wall biosynthesis
MSRLRVMHVVVAGDIGGAERLLVDLATRPADTGADHEVALITPNPALLAYFESSGLRVHDRGPARDNPIAYLARAFGARDLDWLLSILERQRTDVVHTHTFGSHVLGTRAARRARLPQLRTEHHVMHYFDPSCSPFTRWAVARTDRVVCVSEYVRRVLVQTAPGVADRTVVVRNGIDTSYWTPLPRSEGSAFRAGIVCRLTAWKRVHLAVRAAALAGGELVVVGDGEKRKALEALARKHRARARFVGHQPDPRPFIADCDVTLSTADNEPLGLSVLESLSMERPVIAFDGGGIPEIVQHDQTGWLVPSASVEAFAAAIERARAARGRLPAMGEGGRRFAVDQGGQDRMCAGYAAAYRSLAPSSPPSSPVRSPS